MRSRFFVALPGVALLALTACGSGTNTSAAAPSQVDPPATSAPATTTESTVTAASRVTVEGKQLTKEPATNCSTSDGRVIIAVVDMGTGDYQMVGANAAIQESDSAVSMMGVNAGGGSGTPIKINYVAAMPGKKGSATAVKDGNVWTISGEGALEDGRLVPYEIVADCS